MEHPWQELLLHLYVDGQAWFGDLGKNDWRRKAIPVAGLMPQLGVQVINDKWAAQALLRAVTNPANARPHKAFVLRPGNHSEGVLTILVPFVMEQGATPKLSLQLGMLSNQDGEKWFGYRFECPEAAGEEHKYFHAQPIRSFGHGNSLAASIPWYPDRYPTFPLVALDGLELIVSLLLSVREWARVAELRAPATAIPMQTKNGVDKFIKRVRPEAVAVTAAVGA